MSKTYISLQERFRQAEAECSRLPMGFGWEIVLFTDGASVPEFRVNIVTSWDEQLHRPETRLLGISTDDTDEHFGQFIEAVADTVDGIVEKEDWRQKPEKDTAPASSDLPF